MGLQLSLFRRDRPDSGNNWNLGQPVTAAGVPEDEATCRAEVEQLRAEIEAFKRRGFIRSDYLSSSGGRDLSAAASRSSSTSAC